MYQTQLNYVFNRKITKIEWYYSGHEGKYPFSENDNHEFYFLEKLFVNPKADLQAFSNDQIGLGFNYIFSNACSNMAEDFRDFDIAFERKLKSIFNIYNLFEQVFEERAENILSANSQSPLSKLNYVCYMFWDITPLSFAGKVPKDIADKYYKAIANVMERCLYLQNLACIESGLHGLGHLAHQYPEIVEPIIETFLQTQNLNPVLIDYAQHAKTGMIP